MNFTPVQWLIMIVGMLGALSSVSGQLTSLFGQTIATDIASVSAILVAILAVPLSMMTSQGAVVKQVASMPGVQQITVNSAANQTLATIAVDQSQNKVQPAPAAAAQVQATAKGN